MLTWHDREEHILDCRAGLQGGQHVPTGGRLLQHGLVGSPELGEVPDSPVWQMVTDDELPALGLLPHEAQLLLYGLDLIRQQRPHVALMCCLQESGLSSRLHLDQADLLCQPLHAAMATEGSP